MLLFDFKWPFFLAIVKLNFSRISLLSGVYLKIMSNFSPVCRVQTDNIQLNRCIHMILDKEERRKTLKFNFIFKLLLFFSYAR